MARNHRGHYFGGEHGARIEIIPMIDVMMFLLVFFVLISLNVIPAFGIRTALPQSSTATRAAEPRPPLVVSVREDGATALDGHALPLADIAERIAQAVAGDARQRVLVNADQAVRWQAIVEVMDALRARGVEAVTFAAKKSG
ncbi:ExbD/TolR family protein [Derxia lacustris]|uniref:ExbD/TolR family protein n=1 Tax=Derxia lacustris TaxID=764842 RepID=UPI000A171C54|nr:biopolymer transporter ExbD [Derxia lacustris]